MILNNDAFHLGLESWRKQYNANVICLAPVFKDL